MKMRNIGIIISREYLTRVKKKSFLLTTFLVPVLFAAMCILPSVIMFMAKDTGKQVGVVDQSGIVMPYLVDTDAIDYIDYSDQTADSVKASFNELGLDALVVVSAIYQENRTVSVASYSSRLSGTKSVNVFILSCIISILPIPERTINTSEKLAA